MARLACLSLPRLSLQIVQRNHPEWKGKAVAVVREDKPASPLVDLNREASDQGLCAGWRYGEALALVPELRAATVHADQVEAARSETLSILSQWTPEIEICPFDSGIFWANVEGLTSLFGSLSEWGTTLRNRLAQVGLRVRVVVGYTRSGTYLLAKARNRSAVVASPQAERRLVARCPVSVLPISFRAQATLERLGVNTVADLEKIPPAELARRLGADVWADLCRVWETSGLPLQPLHFSEPSERSLRFDAAVSDLSLLAPVVENLLAGALEPIKRRGRLVSEIRLTLRLETREERVEILRPAEPTDDFRTLFRLLRLRLSRGGLSAAIDEVKLCCQEVEAPPQTNELFVSGRRDAKLGAQALALVRAKWGNDSVLYPCLCDSHLPELAFRWGPQAASPSALPLSSGRKFAVRRVFFEPEPRNFGFSRDALVAGPFALSTTVVTAQGEQTIDREYAFQQNSRNEILWIYKDRNSGLRYVAGLVD